MSQSLFSPNQLSFFDPLHSMSARKIRMLEQDWPGYFYRNVLPHLVQLESIFSPLYSSNSNSRPSTPTYLVLGMLVLKSLFNLSDKELEYEINFSLAYQYALGTTSFVKQCVNQRTHNRFRAANALYYQETGVDLLNKFFEELASLQEEIYVGSNRKRRMDSIMIDNGCRKLSRLQLAHVVNKNALFVLEESSISIPETLHHYVEDFDEDPVTCHSKTPAAQKHEAAFRDSITIRKLFPEELQHCEEYNLLNRFISEQIIVTDSGDFESVRNGKALTSTTMNNPADPESTIRSKAGETHQGYVGNFAETVDLDTNRKIIDLADLQQNIYSDIQFAKDQIEKMAEAGNTTTVVADGGYISVDVVNMAAEHGIELVGTAMTGKETPELYKDFKIDEDTGTIVCPAGQTADRAAYSEKSDSWSVSYTIENKCKDCPYHATGECPLKSRKNVRSGRVSSKQIQRATMQQEMGTENFVENYRFRNGVEAIPSQLRRNQNIDYLPFKGLVRKKRGHLLAIVAINVRRVLRYASKDSRKAQFTNRIRAGFNVFLKKSVLFTIFKKLKAKAVCLRWTVLKAAITPPLLSEASKK